MLSLAHGVEQNPHRLVIAGLGRPGEMQRVLRSAAGTIRDLRVAEVVKQDIHLDEGGAITYRTKLQLSFKYEREH